MITIKELKKTKEAAARCFQTAEPVSIIRNGYAALVVISLDGYSRRQAEIWGKSTLITSKDT